MDITANFCSGTDEIAYMCMLQISSTTLDELASTFSPKVKSKKRLGNVHCLKNSHFYSYCCWMRLGQPTGEADLSCLDTTIQ